jgi:citrate lyase subunit beta/citryl-CoA lyase
MQNADPTLRPRRSVLYMPASNQRAIEKARTLACDTVILDLEDAVAPDAKDLARRQAIDAVRAGGFGRREVVIRINALDTPWGAADLEAAVAAKPDGILVPKISTADELARYAAHTKETPLWAMIETCAAIMHVREIGAASREIGAAAWVMGTNDLAKEMRSQLDLDRAPFHAALSLVVLAARTYGISPVDGVYNDIADTEGLQRQCRQGVAFGFDGKTLIHPSQIDAANAAFSPTADEIVWAQRIVDAFGLPENASKGAIRLDGKMVERLHLEQATRALAIAAMAMIGS